MTSIQTMSARDALAAPTTKTLPARGAARSLADQDERELGGGLSVLARQKRDHIELDRLLHRLAATSPEDQGPVLLDIYRLVFPHAFAEEAVLWPVIRRALPDGHRLTLRVEQEHQEINELIHRLERMAPREPGREPLLARIITLLREDVRDEEDVLLPGLQRRMTAGQLKLLGLAWEAVRWIAPTRAHPIVSRRPPGNVLSALPLAIVDRLRDLADGLLHRGPGAAAPPLRALSSGLAATALAIEHIPGMRRGEHESTRIGGRSTRGWGLAALTLAAASAAVMLARRAR